MNDPPGRFNRMNDPLGSFTRMGGNNATKYTYNDDAKQLLNYKYLMRNIKHIPCQILTWFLDLCLRSRNEIEQGNLGQFCLNG